MSELLTLSGWKLTTVTALVGLLPLQTYDTSVPLVDQYLSVVGGWVPNDATDPTGAGLPANGATPIQAAQTITDEQRKRMYHVSTKISVDIDIVVLANLNAGQSVNDVLDQISPSITTLLRNQLDATPFQFNAITALSGSLVTGGDLTPEHRVTLAGVAASTASGSDPLAIALGYAIQQYGLNDMWNIESYYTEPNSTVVVVMKKYETILYKTLDGGDKTQYVISINPDSYTVVGGIVTQYA